MNLDRRSFIAGSALAGLTLVKPSLAQPPHENRKKDEDFSFVFLTDTHVTSKREGDKGYQACVDSINALEPRPAFVLMGGDMVFDGCYTEKDKYKNDARLFKTVSDKLKMPWYGCIGNHDPFGLSNSRKCEMDDPDIGKTWLLKLTGMPDPYYSFDHNGWHFVVLDCIYRKETEKGPSYEARLGEKQLEWLAYDLGANAGKPTVAVMHIAAFCNIGQQTGDKNRKAMDGSMVIWDTRELREILERHKVKALLQGHSHRPEVYLLNGVKYITSPAGSGAWWSGGWGGMEPGYTILKCSGNDLTWEYKYFPWEPQLEETDTLERKKTREWHEWQAQQRKLLEMERAGIKPEKDKQKEQTPEPATT